MAKNSKLKSYVTVANPETPGQPETFGPDDDLPDWARDEITNPDVWEDSEEEEDAGPVPGPSQFVHFDPESDEAQEKAQGAREAKKASGAKKAAPKANADQE